MATSPSESMRHSWTRPYSIPSTLPPVAPAPAAPYSGVMATFTSGATSPIPASGKPEARLTARVSAAADQVQARTEFLGRLTPPPQHPQRYSYAYISAHRYLSHPLDYFNSNPQYDPPTSRLQRAQIRALWASGYLVDKIHQQVGCSWEAVLAVVSRNYTGLNYENVEEDRQWLDQIFGKEWPEPASDASNGGIAPCEWHISPSTLPETDKNI